MQNVFVFVFVYFRPYLSFFHFAFASVAGWAWSGYFLTAALLSTTRIVIIIIKWIVRMQTRGKTSLGVLHANTRHKYANTKTIDRTRWRCPTFLRLCPKCIWDQIQLTKPVSKHNFNPILCRWWWWRFWWSDATRLSEFNRSRPQGEQQQTELFCTKNHNQNRRLQGQNLQWIWPGSGCFRLVLARNEGKNMFPRTVIRTPV